MRIKKTLLYCLMVALMTISVMPVPAQTVTDEPEKDASASPTVTGSDQQGIESLKEKIANKVSEIRKKNNRAVAGFVIANGESTIRINSELNTEYQIKTDEALTKYFRISGSTKKEIEPSEIVTDDYVIVTGVISDKTITANVVLVDERFISGWGKVNEIDADNFQIKVIASDKTVYALDIESTTKQQMMNIKTLVFERSGFTKIKEGDSVHFVVKGKADTKENSFSADKILLIPQEYFIK